MTKVKILGTEWTIYFLTSEDDKILKNCDGYCDKSTRTIVVGEKEDGCELKDFKQFQNKVLRHEIIHAFLFESGLHECFSVDKGHNETTVDWIAVQFPKIQKVFAELRCL